MRYVLEERSGSDCELEADEKAVVMNGGCGTLCPDITIFISTLANLGTACHNNPDRNWHEDERFVSTLLPASGHSESQ